MRNIKKILPRASLILCFVILVQSAARFVYEDYNKYSIYANREYREAKGTIDTLFCGTSHVYYAFDPELFDERLGTTSFNMGTGAQPMSGTYFLIQEALDINPVKTIFLGISFSSLLKAENDSAKLGAYDRLITLRGKLRYIIAEKDNNQRVNELFYSTRVKDYSSPGTIFTNISKKLSPDYKTTTPVSEENKYMYRGYQACDQIFSGKRTTTKNKEHNTWDEANISQENLEYLKKIITLCEKKGVDLNLVMLPVTDAFMVGAGDCQGMHDYYTSLTQEYGIDLYDFINYEERSQDFPAQYFKDSSHLNLTGSRYFGNLFLDMLENNIKNPGDLSK